MPRIRTIKPEFWNDEKIGNLKRECRLLFIGLWNQADDYGTVRSNPVWIKSQVFPYDEDLRTNELSKWLAALVDARMLEPFTHQGEGFYNIRTFLSHQKVDKPSKPLIPLESKALLIGSANTPRILPEGSGPEVVSSTEEKEEDVGTREAPTPPAPPQPSADPAAHQSFEENKRIALMDLAMNGFVDTYARVGIMPDALGRWLDAFHRQLAHDGEQFKQHKDYRKHFGNWIKFQQYSTIQPEDFSPVKAPRTLKAGSGAEPIITIKKKLL